MVSLTRKVSEINLMYSQPKWNTSIKRCPATQAQAFDFSLIGVGEPSKPSYLNDIIKLTSSQYPIKRYQKPFKLTLSEN